MGRPAGEHWLGGLERGCRVKSGTENWRREVQGVHARVVIGSVRTHAPLHRTHTHAYIHTLSLSLSLSLILSHTFSLSLSLSLSLSHTHTHTHTRTPSPPQVSSFLRVLESDLSRGVGGRLDSVLGQCMYFGLSFSRVGADFRGLLAPIFQRAALTAFIDAIKLADSRYACVCARARCVCVYLALRRV